MNVTLHAGFAKNLDLDGSLKAKAWDFITKVSRNPEGGGLDLKLPHAARDRRVRTARVDDNYRAVLFLVGQGATAQLVLAAIKPHDEAYAWAERATMSVNPSSGAVELRVVDAAPADAAPPVPAPRRPQTEAAQCLPFTVAELTGLGVDEHVAVDAITLTDEGDLLELVEGLPRWQSGVLLDLASGRSLDVVRADYAITQVSPEHADTDEALTEALGRPTSQMEFAVVTDDEDLRRMLEGDFAAWRVFLHPSQRAVAYRDVFNGPFRLAGGAGTGKTVVAIHRAVHLARSAPGARVLLCTFNRSLAVALKADAQRLGGSVAARIDVLGVDQLARKVVTEVRGSAPAPLGDNDVLELWTLAASMSGIDDTAASALTPVFLRDEYKYVILALGLGDQATYLKAPRRGRGARLDRAQRVLVWRAVEEYRSLLRQQNVTTYADLAADAVAALGAAVEAGSGRVPGYDHVVVDEGQDLQPVHWRLLRALVAPGRNDLFLCEDAHQRLYGQRIVLSRLGIETRGRSRRLTLNYRTTRQILATALSVLQGEAVEDLDGQSESTTGYRSALSGLTPAVQGFADRGAELDAVVRTVSDWVASGRGGAGEIGVLVRRNKDASDLAERLRRAGVPARLVGPDGQRGREPVNVLTMHRAKGSEYAKVVVARAAADVLPDPYALAGLTDTDLADATARERFLLYVACTRARDELVITWSGAPSLFLLPAAGDGVTPPR